MNYADMTDFEINKAVAKDLGAIIAKSSFGTAYFKPDFSVSELSPGGPADKFNPCNSWADAGPIIQGNYLSIECDDMFDVPMPSSYWKAYNPKGNHYTDENPLRAAMIVFLMMQEGE